MTREETFDKGKKVFKSITTTGIGLLFGNITTILMPEVMVPLRICAYVGSAVIGCMVADNAEVYIDDKFDEFKTIVETAMSENDTE